MKSFELKIYFFLLCISFLSISQNLIGENKAQDKELIDTKLDSVADNDISLKNFYNYYISNPANKCTLILDKTSIEKSYPNHKSPWLAFGLAIMFPGLGQVYNGEYGKLAILYGAAALGAGIGAVAIANSSWGTSKPEPAYVTPLLGIGIGLISGAWLWSIIDAPIATNNINNENRQISFLNMGLINEQEYRINILAGLNKNKFSLKLTMNYKLGD